MLDRRLLKINLTDNLGMKSFQNTYVREEVFEGHYKMRLHDFVTQEKAAIIVSRYFIMSDVGNTVI